jgi:3D (Asp-Asp-Asp) domain-containing protein
LVSKMNLSIFMAIIVMITGTESSLIGEVKGLKQTEDRAGERAADREGRVVIIADRIVGVKGVEAADEVNSFGTTMIQNVSMKRTKEVVILTLEEKGKEEINPSEKTGKSIIHTIADVSAYTSGYESTGKKPGDPDYGITASGKRVKENHTIACPKSMHFGTQIYVPTLRKTYICEDRGSMITEGKLDIYIADVDQARKFGRQKLDVQIFQPI